MSAATALALEKPRRIFQRHPLNIPLDLIALRSGVPETLPGRCTDISEAGVGAMVAGELIPGQHVAVEFRLPSVGVPVRVRALISHHSKLQCGLEFIGLSVEQREMIRYWAYSSSMEAGKYAAAGIRRFKVEETIEEKRDEIISLAEEQTSRPGRKIRLVRRGLYVLLICILALAGLGWWQWQRAWSELERQSMTSEAGMRVSPDAMRKRIVSRVQPRYPEDARSTGTQGMVVLDAVIGEDGSVKRLWPISGADSLIQSAIDAVQFWKFQPYLASGKAVEVETTLAVEFRLN